MYYNSDAESIYNTQDSQVPSVDLRKLVMYTSLGGFATSSNRFYEAPINQGADPIPIELTCEEGIFSVDPDVAYYGLSILFIY